MKKLLGALGACAVLTTASLAMAATASGAIKSIDTKTMMITLDNGASYKAEKGVDIKKFKVGEKVVVTYDVKNGANEATAVKMQ